MTLEEPESHAGYEKGRHAYDEENWVEAIKSFLVAIREDPSHVASYLALIEAYEAAAEEYGDPELLDQASRVCRDALRLKLDARQRAIVDAAADRIAEQLRDASEE